MTRDIILSTFTDLAPDDVRSTSMGSSGVDIQLSPAAAAVFPYSVECRIMLSSLFTGCMLSALLIVLIVHPF